MAPEGIAIDGLVGNDASDDGASDHRRQVPNRVAPTRVLGRCHRNEVCRLKEWAIRVGCDQCRCGATLAGGFECEFRGVRTTIVRNPDRDTADGRIDRRLKSLTADGTTTAMPKGVVELRRDGTRTVLACAAANDHNRFASSMGLLNGRSDFLKPSDTDNRFCGRRFGVDHLLH